MRILRWAAVPMAAVMVLTAQTGKKESKSDQSPMTRKQGEEILDELRRIRELLESQGGRGGVQAPSRAKLNLEGFQMLGSKSAPITVVEFTDYQCPYCQRFHQTVYGELKKNYIDTGKVRFFSRDLPLDSIHPDAVRAAQAGRCAADQGQYWALRDIMGANPGKLDLDSLSADASGLKMNVNAFRTCVTSEKYKEAVQTDVLEAMKIGAEATPTFVVGKTTSTGVDGELLVGAQPMSEFEKAFAKAK
jgi:protein-disulfide isomerase